MNDRWLRARVGPNPAPLRSDKKIRTIGRATESSKGVARNIRRISWGRGEGGGCESQATLFKVRLEDRCALLMKPLASMMRVSISFRSFSWARRDDATLGSREA